MISNSRIYRSEVLHHRLEPVSHRFRYNTCIYGFDLDEIAQLSERLGWLGHNQNRLVSFHDIDHLSGTNQPLREQLTEILAREAYSAPIGQIILVTGARFLGHVFNPASFWFCYSPEGELAVVVAEVNNTFGERHAYILKDPLPAPDGYLAHYRVPKAFYVSPFNAVAGDYDFLLADPRERLDIRLRVYDRENCVFDSWLRGPGEVLQGKTLGAVLLDYPFNVWLTLPRIHWEAALLYFRKKLPVVYKPRPDHPNIVRAEPPTPMHRWAMNLVCSFLGRSRQGALQLDLPNGELLEFGAATPPTATIRVLNYDFFLRLAWDGDVALGDSFVARQWDSPDVTAVIRFLIDNREHLDDRRLTWSRSVAVTWGWIRQKMRANSLTGSRRNIADHYDLGNELYRRFLDPTMSYSCAHYAEPGDNLESAQRRKIAMLIRKARLNERSHLLEIGCGWGSLAIEAVRATGCRVTGLTLSQEQLEWARQRVLEAGLQDRIEILLCDYRTLQGSFDRIISCEMLEAVGHENFPVYFAALERLLCEDGIAVLQVITVPDFSYEEYRRNRDWIQKEVFPGALCPSLTALLQAMSKSSRMVLEHLENIGPHYARTLREWRERFLLSWPELLGHGYDERFRRTWCYYLSYCEAAFATRNLGDVQMVLTRPKNPSLLQEDPSWLR